MDLLMQIIKLETDLLLVILLFFIADVVLSIHFQMIEREKKKMQC
jgi:hypothetical protein